MIGDVVVVNVLVVVYVVIYVAVYVAIYVVAAMTIYSYKFRPS